MANKVATKKVQVCVRQCTACCFNRVMVHHCVNLVSMGVRGVGTVTRSKQEGIGVIDCACVRLYLRAQPGDVEKPVSYALKSWVTDRPFGAVAALRLAAAAASAA
eukprot:scaffold264372_cov18-Tisochrysis_lutea.AAC.1